MGVPALGRWCPAILLVMKPFLHCLVLLGIVLASPLAAQPAAERETNTVAGLLVYTEGLLLTLRSDATAELRQCAARPALTTNDLVQLKTALRKVRDDVVSADIGVQLSNAETRVQRGLAAAASHSTDPDDAVFINGLNVRDFHSRIEAQRARATFLQRDLDRAMRGLSATLEVVTPLQDILSRGDLGDRLGTRLRVLLSEWEKSTPKSESDFVSIVPPATSTAVMVAETAEHTSEAAVKRPASSTRSAPAVRSPPNAARVIKMAQAGVEEQVILGFITSLDTPSGLVTADQIIHTREEGLNDRLISAMLQHDGLLRARAAGRIAPRNPTVSGQSEPLRR